MIAQIKMYCHSYITFWLQMYNLNYRTCGLFYRTKEPASYSNAVQRKIFAANSRTMRTTQAP